MKILLIEPSYKNKYPPLGLMKISAFHKERGDDVYFVKGLNKEYKSKKWERIYISTLFSFYWNITIKTINYYKFSVENPENIFIGGPMATIMAEEIEKETGIKTTKGLLNEKGKLKLPNDEQIDSIVPDYSILDQIDYKYPITNAYITYTTRGCVNKCKFCAVPVLEPKYNHYLPLREQIKIINDKYGEKKDLLLLDNNVLASDQFDKIIDEIKEAGFFKGAKFKGKNRYVDFNQGVDVRLLTREKTKKLSEIAIKPLRIAFDNINLEKIYCERIEWAVEFGIVDLSNYILYNYEDTPEDFYQRLRINVELNELLGSKIFSFPMKYIPIKNKDRKYIGKHWNARYLRGIQCILNATHGVVGPKKQFFEIAFGKDVEEFKKIISMPDDYIMYRKKNRCNEIEEWNKIYNELGPEDVEVFLSLINSNKDIRKVENDNFKINAILSHY